MNRWYFFSKILLHLHQFHATPVSTDPGLEEREKERERQRQEQAEQTKKDLALAKLLA